MDAQAGFAALVDALAGEPDVAPPDTEGPAGEPATDLPPTREALAGARTRPA